MTISSFDQASASAQKKLPVCLKTPNCVSSQTSILDKQHYIEPFKIGGNADAAWQALKQNLSAQDRLVITHDSHDSLHAEATSLIFHFVDDIDVILDRQALLIHVRSASRIGHSDFGVNRRRIETMRTQLQKAGIIE